MAYIYCYTNKVNGKKYIGQSNNPERRKREHKSLSRNKKYSDYNMPFYHAIRKYGFDSFDFEILTETNNPNEDEIYYISKFNTIETGYNVQTGGHEGFSHFMKSLNESEIKDVRKLISQGRNKEIKEKYSISDTLISNINHGLSYYDKDIVYPIKKYIKTEEDYQELIYLLKNTTMSFQKIADKLDMGVSTVKKINYGKLNKGLSESYPIRPYTRKPVSTIPQA